jgi:integrase
VVIAYRERSEGLVAYARWRDSTRSQRTQRVGVVWAERYGGAYRNRRGKRPEGALTVQEANALAVRLKDEQEVKLTAAAAGREENTQTTFKTVADRWLSYGETEGDWSPLSVRNRRYTVKELSGTFGDMPVRAITPTHVKTWWTEMHSPRRMGGPASNRNANRLHSELRAILSWAADDYEIELNPASGIKRHSERTNDDAPPFFSVEEVEALSRQASERDAVIFRTAAFAGLRRGEVLSLRWGRVDFTRSSLYICESVGVDKDERVRPKWQSTRSLPMAPQLAHVLAAWQPEDADDDDLVFPSGLGGKLDGSALRRRYAVARDKAGLRALPFHALRHTFASLAVAGGADLVAVKTWLGHRDLRTTARYLHHKDRTTDAALLGAAFGGVVEQAAALESR